MKRILSVMLLLALPGVGVAADDPTQLAEEAVQANPGLMAMRAQTRELWHLASVAGTWKDPLLGVEYLNTPVDSWRLDQTPMSGLQIKLQQNLPELGWSKAAREVADHRVVTSEHATAEAELRLRRSVETLFWKLTLSNLLEGVTDEHVQRTQELLTAVRARYEVGKTGQSTVLRLGVLRDRLADDLGDFRSAERDLSAGLARALSRPPESRFQTPVEIQPLVLEGGARNWTERAVSNRPELSRIREQIALQRKAAQLARITTRPDVDVWVKYRYRNVDTPLDDGTDFVSLGLSLPIPWGSRKRGLGQQAAHLEGAQSAGSQLASAIDTIEADLISIEADWSRAYEKGTRYRDRLLPDARSTLETTLADFTVDKADFASLYEAEVDLLVLEKAYLIATIETYLQRTAAKATIGVAVLGEPQ